MTTDNKLETGGPMFPWGEGGQILGGALLSNCGRPAYRWVEVQKP